MMNFDKEWQFLNFNLPMLLKKHRIIFWKFLMFLTLIDKSKCLKLYLHEQSSSVHSSCNADELFSRHVIF